MFSRQVGSSLVRLPVYARLPFRPSPFQCQAATPIVFSHRSYASPGRPRKTVGEPSRPVKRAVKRTAKAADGPAKKLVKEREAKAAAKKKKAPAPKKKRARKELTEEQQAAAKAKIANAKILDLKKAALKPPAKQNLSAYNAFFAENMRGVDGKHMTGENRAESMGRLTRPVAEKWKSLSPAELEHWNHVSHTSTEALQAEYKRWVQSHTPEQIQLANRARAQLRRKLGDAVKHRRLYSAIKDERLVKRPASAWLQFSVNRHASGDFKHIKMAERMQLISKEWKALAESEKEKYKALQDQEHRRYDEEFTSVYGHAPPHVHQAAAAAA